MTTRIDREVAVRVGRLVADGVLTVEQAELVIDELAEDDEEADDGG